MAVSEYQYDYQCIPNNHQPHCSADTGISFSISELSPLFKLPIWKHWLSEVSLQRNWIHSSACWITAPVWVTFREKIQLNPPVFYKLWESLAFSQLFPHCFHCWYSGMKVRGKGVLRVVESDCKIFTKNSKKVWTYWIFLLDTFNLTTKDWKKRI